jgi:hypothetical protein
MRVDFNSSSNRYLKSADCLRGAQKIGICYEKVGSTLEKTFGEL